MRTWGQCNQVPSLGHPFTFCGAPLGEYDMDQIRQEQYSAALRRMQDTLKPLGIPYIQQMWNPAYNGIDDYKLHSRRLSLAA